MVISKRRFLGLIAGTAVIYSGHIRLLGAQTIQKLKLSEQEWRTRLSPARFRILRKHGTEKRYSSPLNNENRKGTYHCAGCDLPIFKSSAKFDSGTGWPSFYRVIPGRVGTKRDTSFGMVRTEYHCIRCSGHHGHLFNDGPKPTGLRYCNNGLALKFVPNQS